MEKTIPPKEKGDLNKAQQTSDSFSVGVYIIDKKGLIFTSPSSELFNNEIKNAKPEIIQVLEKLEMDGRAVTFSGKVKHFHITLDEYSTILDQIYPQDPSLRR